MKRLKELKRLKRLKELKRLKRLKGSIVRGDGGVRGAGRGGGGGRSGEEAAEFEGELAKIACGEILGGCAVVGRKVDRNARLVVFGVAEAPGLAATEQGAEGVGNGRAFAKEDDRPRHVGGNHGSRPAGRFEIHADDIGEQAVGDADLEGEEPQPGGVGLCVDEVRR